VLQVRLDPTIDSNVVSYTAVIDAPNVDLKLKPGMTATLSIVVGRRDNVLRVPVSALTFRPGADVLAHYAAKDATVPPATATTVWISNGTSIAPVAVTIGASDDIYTEIVSAPFGEGARVVTRMST